VGWNWREDREVLREVEAFFDPPRDEEDLFTEILQEAGLLWREGDSIRDFPLGALSKGRFKSLILASWWVNTEAKMEDYAFYEIKDALLRAASARAPEGITWGLGQDETGGEVLYFDLPRRGQISFHVFFEDEVRDNLPQYPYRWTGVRVYESNLCPVKAATARDALRDLRNGNHRGWTVGEVHSLFVRAGLDPALVYSPN